MDISNRMPASELRPYWRLDSVITCVMLSCRMLGTESVDGDGRAKPGLARPKNIPVGVR